MCLGLRELLTHCMAGGGWLVLHRLTCSEEAGVTHDLDITSVSSVLTQSRGGNNIQAKQTNRPILSGRGNHTSTIRCKDHLRRSIHNHTD